MRRTLLILMAALAGCGCMCGGCGCAESHEYSTVEQYRHAEVQARCERAQPVADALERHRQDRGTYPKSLDELRAAGYITELPDLRDTTDHKGKAGRIDRAEALAYRPSPDGSQFALRVEVETTGATHWRDYAKRQVRYYFSRRPGWAPEWRLPDGTTFDNISGAGPGPGGAGRGGVTGR